MPNIRLSEVRQIPAPAPAIYEIIADYRTGHPHILPAKYFGALDVLEGGRGAGTKIRFEMKAFGRLNIATGDVTEPRPGTELRETLTSGIVTTFLVEPREPNAAMVTITTEYDKPGILGWFEKILATSYLRRVYTAELAQLEHVALERLRTS